MSKDRITLTVPARGDFARTVRMAAAELAARMGMSYEEVDDVRMAVEEAFVYACERMDEDRDVTFAFTVGNGELSAEVGPLPACDAGEGAATGSYAEFILQSVCDEFSIDDDGETCILRMTRRADPEGARE
ncbi:MAG: ATP-binding protein [Coriobacteriia bacterium]